MSKQTLELLAKGNSKIVDMYREAAEIWQEILHRIDQLSIEDLSQELFEKQMRFEKISVSKHEHRILGQEIMAYYPFAYLYNSNDGIHFEDKPRLVKIAKAFEQSFCSLEVKYYAEKAAKFYHVDEFDDYIS